MGRKDASFGHDATGDELGGSDVKGRIPATDPVGGYADGSDVGHFCRGPLLDRNALAGRQLEVDG